MKLSKDYYTGNDVVKIARDLIGKVLFTNLGNEICAGVITETEAYNGSIDRASHAFNNRKTERTRVMFLEGGVAYVYLCYGIHSLFNVVTGSADVPHAVLIRAIKPVKGIPVMMKRRNVEVYRITDFSGPGKVAQALGIATKHTGESLEGKKIWIEDQGIIIRKKDLVVSPRIGVDYAGEDALLPYRFLYKGDI